MSTVSKEHTSSRGLKYKYLFSSPKDKKQTLLFLHGFPSTSRDWRHQIAFFQEQGYGIIAPDMLGYGETAKPVNPEEYKWSLMAADMVDILDHENVDKAVVVGHDWFVSCL
jgi:soluble epoxide hydrolase/lipid-phosphate phosphatase